ncbi:PspC domain-containing protein [Streptacidiphilus carbonis]|uniref:PspC domain-containing protein n=1 Tax=Streptacidiphilus carbonis TaxID=105422 RepID=UPI0005AA71FD|nr:PspC domain-containing protein [Streptacidiphilus carbonis]
MKDDTPPPQAPNPTAPQPARAARPPLERSRDRRVVAGVCGGLGRHLDIDPVVFRVVIAVLCLSGGVGLFIYGLAWLIVPVERTRRNELQRLLSGRVDGQSLGAVLVTVLGTGIFFSYMGSTGHIFPLTLIALLAFAALRYDPAKHPRRWEQPVTGAPEDADGAGGGVEGSVFGLKFRTNPQAPPPEQPTVPVPAPAAPWWQRPDPMAKHPSGAAGGTGTAPSDSTRAHGAGPDADGDAAAPQDAVPTEPLPPYAPPNPPPPAAPEPPFAPVPAPRRRRQRSFLGSAFFFLAVIAGAAVWWVAAKDNRPVNLLAVLAAALLVLGLGMVVCAVWGRGRGLVVWATLLTLAVAAVGAGPIHLRSTYQHQTWAPTAAASVLPNYDLDGGTGILDLSGAAPTAGQTVATKVRVEFGKLTVIVPPGTELKIDAHVGIGSIHLPDNSSTGGISTNRSTDIAPEAAAGHGTVSLDLNVGVGDLEVTQ